MCTNSLALWLICLRYTAENQHIFLGNSSCRTPTGFLEVDISQSQAPWSCHRVTTLFYLRRHLSCEIAPCFNQSLLRGCAYQVAVESVWFDERAAVDEAQLWSDRYQEDRRMMGNIRCRVLMPFIRQKWESKQLPSLKWGWILTL